VEVQSETDRYIVWPRPGPRLQDRIAENHRAARTRPPRARRPASTSAPSTTKSSARERCRWMCWSRGLTIGSGGRRSRGRRAAGDERTIEWYDSAHEIWCNIYHGFCRTFWFCRGKFATRQNSSPVCLCELPFVTAEWRSSRPPREVRIVKKGRIRIAVPVQESGVLRK